ncbi:uncharacterized protein UV8b_00326 [Ustilaginoidea virens]|uniref:Uncharacterized protein n=1 Tax=Ustilaginoidea virens TaxID=1159556 RepID=A0A8E5HIJ1_USTVR|nr:uncharacterized protein UV8b_00326 [Ustilaginoidea virens]QUC16085.1 hypothetical protein UV8b_00326 [Ustilaginoidea virens]
MCLDHGPDSAATSAWVTSAIAGCANFCRRRGSGWDRTSFLLPGHCCTRLLRCLAVFARLLGPWDFLTLETFSGPGPLDLGNHFDLVDLGNLVVLILWIFLTCHPSLDPLALPEVS